MKYYSKILTYVKPYYGTLLVSLLFSLLYVIMNTASLWMVSSLISSILNPDSFTLPTGNLSTIQKLESATLNLIGSGNKFHQLKMLCLFLFITFLFKNIFLYLSERLMSYVNNRMIMDVRIDLFKHLQFLPLTFFNKNKTGEISSIVLSDGAQIRMAVTAASKKLLKEPLDILFMITMLFLINVKMTLISLIIIPLVGIIVSAIGKSIRRKAKRSSEKIAGITNIINENIIGMQVVKSFVREYSQIKKFTSESFKYFQLMFRKDKLTIITSPINDMIGVSIAVILLWIGGNEVFNNASMGPDEFMKFIIFLFAIMKPAKSLAGVSLMIQTSLASAERVFKILEAKTQAEEKNTTDKNSFNSDINITNLNFSYDGKEQILNNISFEIQKGKKIAIVGRSGSGKSTLINLLPRFYEIDTNQISIDGIDIRNISLKSLRKLISTVPQDSFLFNDTIMNNITFGKADATGEEVIEACKKANADKFINKLPEKYNTIIGERGVRLSGGQRQRLSIARAILKESPILILDEATASLDSDSEKEVHKAIDNLIKNKTVIIIAHRLSTIMSADHIIVINNGKLVEQGTHQELINQSGEYKFLYDGQFKE